MISWAYVALSKNRNVEEMLFLFAMAADVGIVALIGSFVLEIFKLKCR